MTFDEYIHGVDIYSEEDYLEHYGILGMKWGIRRTPEELGHYVNKQQTKLKKSVEAARKFRDAGDTKNLKKQNKKTDKIIKNIEDANSEIKRLNDEKEEERQRILKEGTADEIYNRKSDYSVEELNQAITRIQTENRLQQIPFDEADKAMNRVINMGNNFVRGFNTYESVASATNSILGKEFLPNFTEKYKEKKEKLKKQEEERKNKPINDIVRSGDFNTVINNREKLTDSQFKEAMNRINEETKVHSNLSAAVNKARQAVSDRNTRIETLKGDISSAKANSNALKETNKQLNASIEALDRTISNHEKEKKKAEKIIDKYNSDVARGRTPSITPAEYATQVGIRDARASAISSAETQKIAWNANITTNQTAINDYFNAIKAAERKLKDINEPSQALTNYVNNFEDEYYDTLVGRY